MQDAHPPLHDPSQSVVSIVVGDESRHPTNRVRVAIYARVSTSDGRQEVENQLSELRVFAERQGWEVVEEYIDHESGSKADRTEFRRIFVDAAQRRFDLALVWALDRLTREGVAETFERIKRLASHGVQFVSFTEEHFRTTGPAGELMIAVAAWIAKQERIRISERVRAGLERARVKGTKSGKAVGRPKVVIDGERVVELHHSEYSWRQTARALGAKVRTVRRAYKVAIARRQACERPVTEALGATTETDLSNPLSSVGVTTVCSAYQSMKPKHDLPKPGE